MPKPSRRNFIAKAASVPALSTVPLAGAPQDTTTFDVKTHPIQRGAGYAGKRGLHRVQLQADLAVIGGSLSGTCAAITAARAGIRVVLIQDRPVLGGNASSEVRLWILGATAHMGNNNRWAREGGLLDEICVENLHRNPEGNPVIVDTILLEKVKEEPNIMLLLNAAVDDLEKSAPDRIASVRAYCSQNETEYIVSAPLFCDASGDGIAAFRAGAAFRMGAESREEFGEAFAPTDAYGQLLGHSMYFYSKDAGKPVRYIAPSYALKDITKLPKWEKLTPSLNGCTLWWLEWGGRGDTVHNTEDIKWELWRVVYGVWDYIKNSGRFPDAENLALEWVSTIPGKRESRRFEGDYMLRQQDVVEQRVHPDAVSYGGWSIDLHPADGMYSEFPSCVQYHSKGVYQIPYRSLYSRNISNLFLCGRIISASHVAFGTTRVMATCSNSGQAAGMAAALCTRNKLLPRDISQAPHIGLLQRELIKAGQHIPGIALRDPADLAQRASITASSTLRLAALPPSGKLRRLDENWAMMLPLEKGPVPRFTFQADVAAPVDLQVELRTSSRLGNFTPDRTIAKRTISLKQGNAQSISCEFGASLDQAQYAFVVLAKNSAVRIALSDHRVTGVLAVAHAGASRVQLPPAGSGIDTFEIWAPKRRPGGENLAVVFEPPVNAYQPSFVTNGVARPLVQSNAWVASREDAKPSLTLTWAAPQAIREIVLGFDTDFDHPMESVLYGQPERNMPFCVDRYRIVDDQGRVLHKCEHNHQTRNRVILPQPASSRSIRIEIEATHGSPAALFEVRCYA
ncbi:MAG: FAD-dependent oxidoreductase [Acidobacteria bacterium]|nr:FAD-dependent oxidoreductase [Acidobacteriota bacterium]